MANSRKLIVEIVGDSSSLQRSFKQSSRSASVFGRDLTGASKGAIAATIGFRGLGRSLAFASTSFLGGVGFAAAAKAAVNAATQIQEETEKTGVVFGQNAKEVQAWAGTLAQSFGVGEGSALKAAGVFGNMFRSLHLSEPAAAKMSERLVQLAADMASFNNVSPEDTLAALQSGLAGQVRPLRQFGVFLSQDRLKAEAYADGIAKAGSKLNATQKVQAAYNIILKDTSIQQGDVARNTGSLSVAQSKLRAQLEDSEAIIGRALLPSLVKLSNEFAVYLDKLNKSGTLQRDAAKAAEDVSRGLHDIATAANEAKGLIEKVDKVTGSFGNTLKIVAGAFLVVKARAVLAWAGVTSQVAAASAAELGAATTAATVAGRIAAATGEMAAGWDAVAGSANAAAAAEARAGAGGGGGGGGGGSGGFLGGAAAGAGAGLLTRGGALARAAVGGFVLGDTEAVGKARIVNGRWQFRIGGKWVDVGPASTKGAGVNPFAPSRFGSGDLGLGALTSTFPKSAADAFAKAAAAASHKTGTSLQGRFNLSQLALAQAQVAGDTALQKKILQSQAAILKAEAAAATTLQKRTDLTQQLAGVEDQIRGLNAASVSDAKKAATAAKKARRAAADFSVPLILQVAQARAEALGKPTTSILEKIRTVARKALKSGQLGLQGQLSAWQTIADVNGQLQDSAKTFATKFQKASTRKLVQGLDLSASDIKRLRSRLSQIGVGGTIPTAGFGAFGVPVTANGTVIQHTTINMDGKKVASVVTRHQQRSSRRNPQQRRGRA